MIKEDWEKLSFGEKAWKLGLIISYMNHEGAYYSSGWLFIWPDGETYPECMYDFEKEEYYLELEKIFIECYSYKAYHKAGLYSCRKVPNEVIEAAHYWDEVLGLPPIQVIE